MQIEIEQKANLTLPQSCPISYTQNSEYDFSTHLRKYNMSAQEPDIQGVSVVFLGILTPKFFSPLGLLRKALLGRRKQMRLRLMLFTLR